MTKQPTVNPMPVSNVINEINDAQANEKQEAQSLKVFPSTEMNE